MDVFAKDYSITSNAFCYESLIGCSLLQNGCTDNQKSIYFNFLPDLAFKIFEKGEKSISQIELKEIYDEYSKVYSIIEFEEMKNVLYLSKILSFDSGEVKFGYIYIYYFLVAKKIAKLLRDKEGNKRANEQVNALFEGIHITKNANILILLMHHLDDKNFIEEATFRLMLPFENKPYLTLEKDCIYFKNINEIISEIKETVIENRDPKTEQNSYLKKLDEQEQYDRNNGNDMEDIKNKDILLLIQAIKSIEVVGQIIKNHHGTLKKKQCHDVVKELYLASFRTINQFGKYISDFKKEISAKIEKEIDPLSSESIILGKIRILLNHLSFQLCMNFFNLITNSVGVAENKELYLNVAKEINTPAAHLVSFSINIRFGKLFYVDVEKLADEFNNNEVVMQILRKNVQWYLYNNKVDYGEIEKLCALLNMKYEHSIKRMNQKNK